MNNNEIVNALFDAVQNNNLDIAGADKKFYTKLVLHASEIRDLYTQLYGKHPACQQHFTTLIQVLIAAHQNRPQHLRDRDNKKPENWYLSNEMAGMSLSMTQFSNGLVDVQGKLDYFQDLGISLLHLLPFFKIPKPKNISVYEFDFQQIDQHSETLNSIEEFRTALHARDMFLMLNASSEQSSNPSESNFKIDAIDPQVFVEMLDNVLYYANLGADVLQIKAGSFLSKESEFIGSDLPQAHTILQLVKQCVQVTAPGMALASGEIVDSAASMKYFGEERYLAKECDFVYNATQLTQQWDALATGQVSTMMAELSVLAEKPYGTTWITYTRNQNAIDSAGTLASLCGLGKAINEKSELQINTSIQKILLMQATSFFTGGLPMLCYGDEVGKMNEDLPQDSKIASKIFAETKRLLSIRAKLDVVADTNNTRWLPRHNIHIAGFVRNGREKPLFCVFNYSNESAYLTWHSFHHNGHQPGKLFDHWRENYFEPGNDADFLVLEPYAFYLLEVIE